MDKCPVCHRSAKVAERDFHSREVLCPACGRFAIDTDFLDDWEWKPEEGARLSHGIRKMQRDHGRALVSADLARKILADPLPSVREQADTFVLWIGNQLRLADPTKLIQLDGNSTAESVAIIGGVDDGTVGYLASELRDQGLIRWDSLNVGLTLSGWERYEELLKGIRISKTAFMAMSFDKEHIEEAFQKCFTLAVRRTGFKLRKVTDGQPAGIIDDHIRVAIRRARFVIADLTGGNQGAYWEAGFAEGLGKPVVYTCEAAEFEKQKTHFDTNHHVTIPWALDQLKDAEEKLVATIRNTLPDEAKLED